MSTPDDGARSPTGALPAEHRLAVGHVPDPAEAQSFGAPTPGIALAAARVPGGPSLPDGDPTSLTLVLARMANEMFGSSTSLPITTTDVTSTATPVLLSPGFAPATHGIAPISGEPTSPAIASPPTNATPTPVSSPPPTAPSPASSPFIVPLDFNAIDVAPEPLVAMPLLDGAPSSDALDPAQLPYFVPTTAPTAANPSPTSIESFEISPTRDLDLRRSAGEPFDPNAIRREFPILDERVNGKRLVWLDNAATTQKPRAVIDRLSVYYTRENSNVHRAAHTLAARATDAYESARETVRRFLNARSKNEIIFVRGATEGINLVAQSWGRRNVQPGDEIVLTWLEHHANIVPWQMLCSEKGARLRIAPVDDRGQVILEEYEKLLNPRTRIVAMTHVSNALGTVTPAAQMIEMAHRHGAKVLLDGAQSVSHMRVDLQRLDCDFFAFSGHKVFAPTGIGVVWAKEPILEQMPPWQGGGNMIRDVTFERTLYQDPPWRFEAGTGSIADAAGLGAAIDWLSRVGIDNVSRYEHELLEYGTARLREVPGLTMIGTAPEKAGVLSFVLAGQKTEEVGGLLDREGIAVRSGHHCAQPILRRFGLEATVRASLAPYNTCEDIDALVDALERLQIGHRAVR